MAKYYKEALKRLKAKRDVSSELLETNRDRTKLVSAVKSAIQKKDLHSVPEISTIVQFTPHEIFMAINFLMKYDNLVLLTKKGDYPTYGYIEVT